MGKLSQWSQLVKTFLKVKGKLNHLNGTSPKPEDPKFNTWDEEDSMTMSWLWNSMEPEISKNCMFVTIANKIWETTHQTYSKAEDYELCYNSKVKTQISATKQGNISK